MAVPTITDISPSSGPTGGRTVVKITGTNFAVPPEPPDNTHWAQTVQVLFNGVACEQVLPYGADMVACLVPHYLGDFQITNPQTNSVAVDVTLRNLDPDTGLPVSGEEVIETDGWSYTRQEVSDDDAVKWVAEHVAKHLRRQTIDNVVVLAAHPDYDPNQATVKVEIQEVPAIVLTPREERVQFLGTEQSDVGVATAASVADTTTYPVTGGTGTLKVRIDRAALPSQSIVFDGTETTAAEIAATIDDQVTGATAAEDGGQAKITSDTDGANSFVQVTANPSGNPALTFPTAEAQGTPEEQRKVMGGTWIDIYFGVRGIEHKVKRLANLASMVEEFVLRSGAMPVPETVGDYDSDILSFYAEMVSEPVFPDVPENSLLVKEFLATFVVRGLVVGGGGIAALEEDFHSYVGAPDVDLDLEKHDG